jgi:hypothetical protein
MTSTTTARATAKPGIKSLAVSGAVGGIVGSMGMAMYAMIAAATYQGSGFFTPLYHIASLFIAPDKMMTSMQSAMAGSNFEFFFGAALLGAMIHMMTGVMFGAPFGIVAGLGRLGGATLVVAGSVWGAAVFVMSAFVGLPLAAALFNSGDQITDMAEKVGYGTFLVEHVIFGMVLGLWLAFRSAKRS